MAAGKFTKGQVLSMFDSDCSELGSDISSDESGDEWVSDGDETDSDDSQTLYDLDTETSSSSTDQWKPLSSHTPSLPAFTGQQKLIVDDTNFEAVDYFKLFFDDDLVNHIVTETNRYVEQQLHFNPATAKSRSRMCRWIPTTSEEIRKFFGLTFLMDIIKKPEIAMYWSKDPLYATPIFAKIMPCDRYQTLLRFLQYADNSAPPDPANRDRDRLYKVRSLIDHLFEKFQTVYSVSQQVSVDESLMIWKGRLLLRQHQPLAQSRYGIKLYKLCESTTGYTYRFQVYVGKDSSFSLPVGALSPAVKLSATEKIVWYLMLPLLNKGHHLYCDNFCTSTSLFDALLQNQTAACGRVRCRKDMPKALVSKKQSFGETSFMKRDSLVAARFSGRKDIYMLTSIHDNTCHTVPIQCRATSTLNKPTCLLEHKKYMGGVDLSDKLFKPYDASLKSMVWYKKLSMYLLQHAMMNAFVLYRQSSSSSTATSLKHNNLLDYMHNVISDLLFSANDNVDNHVDEGKSECVSRLTGRHFPDKITATDCKARPTKRCRVCYKKGRRAETRYCCTKCPSKPALCIDDCFAAYHTKTAYWK